MAFNYLKMFYNVSIWHEIILNFWLVMRTQKHKNNACHSIETITY